jgi:hypothetical protein
MIKYVYNVIKREFLQTILIKYFYFYEIIYIFTVLIKVIYKKFEV